MGTIDLMGDENEQNISDRTKGPVYIATTDAVGPSINIKHDRAPVMTTGMDRHTGTRYGVGLGTVDRSANFDVHNAFPSASLQGSRPRRTAVSPWYLKDFIRG